MDKIAGRHPIFRFDTSRRSSMLPIGAHAASHELQRTRPPECVEFFDRLAPYLGPIRYPEFGQWAPRICVFPNDSRKGRGFNPPLFARLADGDGLARFQRDQALRREACCACAQPIAMPVRSR
jgi:hypothetical protein